MARGRARRKGAVEALAPTRGEGLGWGGNFCWTAWTTVEEEKSGRVLSCARTPLCSAILVSGIERGRKCMVRHFGKERLAERSVRLGRCRKVWRPMILPHWGRCPKRAAGGYAGKAAIAAARCCALVN